MAEPIDPSTPVPGDTEPVTPPPSTPESGSSGIQPNLAAGLACIFSILGGVIFLVIEKKNAFVRFYAMQSIFLGGASLCIGFVLTVFSVIFSHIPILGWIVLLMVGIVNLLIGIGFFVVYIITIIKAFTGVEWEIPFLGPLARKQLKTSPI
ncbi:MAG: hypothetical protein WCD79_16400 [Chthoniobacteraceae bacterium]